MWSCYSRIGTIPSGGKSWGLSCPDSSDPITGGTRLNKYLVDFATNRVVWGPCHTREQISATVRNESIKLINEPCEPMVRVPPNAALHSLANGILALLRT